MTVDGDSPRASDTPSGGAWTDAETPLSTVAAHLAQFNADRDWGQFHTPKDLAICLTCEAAEVLEEFMWKRPGEPHDADAVAQELADVLLCTINLAQRVGVDLLAAAQAKVALNAAKYPVALARGSALKYDRLEKSVSDSTE